MKKILITETIIEKCNDCCYKVWVISEHCYCCEKSRLEDIKDALYSIPKWCRLPDYKE